MIPDFDTTALHADGFKVENDGASWESWDPAGDAGASPDYADTLRETVPGSPQTRSNTRQPPTSSSTSTALQAN